MLYAADFHGKEYAMHKENKDTNKQQESILHPPETTDQLDQLSDVWRELLGNRRNEKLVPAFPGDAPIPTLKVDPWSALLQANGVEVVDLRRIHLQISDQEVEQLLEVMPEDPESSPLKPSKPFGGREEERACKETGLNN
jgi:hypothetical protein